MSDSALKVQRAKILIVDDDRAIGESLRMLLQALGHEVTGYATNADQALEIFQQNIPDLVLVDIKLDHTDGISLIETLHKVQEVPAVILSGFADNLLVERAAAAGVFGYLMKPATKEALSAQIEIALKRFAEHDELKEVNEALKQSLEDRKHIEKAKGILMRRLRISEPDAHKRLQQESQKRRLALGQLAKRLIEAEEMLS